MAGGLETFTGQLYGLSGRQNGHCVHLSEPLTLLGRSSGSVSSVLSVEEAQRPERAVPDCVLRRHGASVAFYSPDGFYLSVFHWRLSASSDVRQFLPAVPAEPGAHGWHFRGIPVAVPGFFPGSFRPSGFSGLCKNLPDMAAFLDFCIIRYWMKK